MQSLSTARFSLTAHTYNYAIALRHMLVIKVVKPSQPVTINNLFICLDII